MGGPVAADLKIFWGDHGLPIVVRHKVQYDSCPFIRDIPRDSVDECAASTLHDHYRSCNLLQHCCVSEGESTKYSMRIELYQVRMQYVSQYVFFLIGKTSLFQTQR